MLLKKTLIGNEVHVSERLLLGIYQLLHLDFIIQKIITVRSYICVSMFVWLSILDFTDDKQISIEKF